MKILEIRAVRTSLKLAAGTACVAAVLGLIAAVGAIALHVAPTLPVMLTPPGKGGAAPYWFTTIYVGFLVLLVTGLIGGVVPILLRLLAAIGEHALAALGATSFKADQA